MSEDTNCEEHDRKITELDTTVKNGKFAIGIALTVGCFVFTFVMTVIGWVINDNLSGIRLELREFKTIAYTTKDTVALVKADVDSLKVWRDNTMEDLKYKYK